MAVSISLMFGRLGGVAGSNLTAILLDASCENAFYLPGCSLLGKYSKFMPCINSILGQIFDKIGFSLFFHFLVCAVLAFFIPNIHQKMSKPDLQDDRRGSITSTRV